VTEQIVFEDENYEEVDRPTQARLQLAPEMQTASSELNSRVEAYLEHRLMMSSFVAGIPQQRHWSEIDALFAESFPNARLEARRLARQYLPLQTGASRPAESLEHSDEACAREPRRILDARGVVGKGGHGEKAESTPGMTETCTSAFTTAVPAEVSLFFAGAVDTNGRNLETDLKEERTSEPYLDVDGAEANNDTSGEEENLWQHDLELYLDSTAWEASNFDTCSNHSQH
jgi:hypothetical protein